MPTQNSESMTLTIGDLKIGNWDKVDTDSDLFIPADSWTLSLYNPLGQLPKQVAEGADVYLSYRGEIILNGVIDQIGESVDAQSHTISVIGRDIAGQLLDCSAPVFGTSQSDYDALAQQLGLADGIRRVAANAVQSAREAVVTKITSAADSAMMAQLQLQSIGVLQSEQTATTQADIEDVFQRGILWRESNYRQFGDDGKPLTSSAGAIGIAQVMPRTAPFAAKLAGVPFDDHRYRNDANYNASLGLAYFKWCLQQRGGDVDQAIAAYNAGPGGRKTQAGVDYRVRTYGADWLRYMPAETQTYVRVIKEHLAGGGAAAPASLNNPDDGLLDDESENQTGIEAGQSQWEVLSRAAEANGDYLWVEPDGMIAVGNPFGHYKAAPLIFKRDGTGNVQSIARVRDGTQTYSQINIVGQSATSKGVVASVQGRGRPRLLVITASNFDSNQHAQRFAEKAMTDAIFAADQLQVFVLDWIESKSGKCWRAGWTVPVQTDVLDVTADWVVCGRRLLLSRESGRITELRLRRAGTWSNPVGLGQDEQTPKRRRSHVETAEESRAKAEAQIRELE